jgi:hypothetical protein
MALSDEAMQKYEAIIIKESDNLCDVLEGGSSCAELKTESSDTVFNMSHICKDIQLERY